MTTKTNSLRSVFTALFAALICAGSMMTIPVGPVPIVLQNAFAILAGLLLGPVQGAGAVGLFLMAGTLGLPVFAGGKGGFAVLTGPTGGYLAGYFIGAVAAGFMMRSKADEVQGGRLVRIITATLAGFACIYIPGVLVLASKLQIPLSTALTKGFIPFLTADLIKIAALIPITFKLQPVIARYLDPDA